MTLDKDQIEVFRSVESNYKSNMLRDGRAGVFAYAADSMSSGEPINQLIISRKQRMYGYECERCPDGPP